MSESPVHTQPPWRQADGPFGDRIEVSADAPIDAMFGTPFDAFAATYDRTFAQSLLGSLLRDAVHHEMRGAFRAGDHVLDLGCGTGEDALRLAQRGIIVHGVDQSPEMLRRARAKTAGLGVSFSTADLDGSSLSLGSGEFDGALANFGSLNMLRDRRFVARELGRLVRPGGRVFLVAMGRWCPWEWLWYASRGHFRTALRRVRGAADSTAGTVYYPLPAELAAAFSGDFEHVRTSGIGVLLPPTYASALVERHGSIFRRAARLERRIRHSRLAAAYNDHFLLELCRREPSASRLFTCPSCRSPLEPGEITESLHCPAEDASYEKRDGILHLMADDRSRAFEQFVSEYDEVRQAEGRGADAPAYYRRLPFEDTTGRFTRDWRIRAASYRALLRRVVEPLECEKRVLRVLDLGAGCGWLSYRLSQRGHHAFAVDLRTDPRDGLGAHVHYDAVFTPIRAEFDGLPFAANSFDLIVFNASFHYSERYERTLVEALRTLADGGRIAIVDSPIYERSFSGSWMVAAREREFMERYGFASNAVKSEHYLTRARLQVLAAETGISWIIHKPFYSLRWALRPLIARLKRSCEPACFAVIEGHSRLDVEKDLRAARPNPVMRAVGRAYHRARRLLTDRQDRPRTIEAAGLRLEVAYDVFDPLLYRTGAFLADVVRRLNLEGRSVLDLGTGSGISAIVAALWGAEVTATDVSPAALACTEMNAGVYAVDVDIRRSDLFDSLSGRRFDVVLFNPPYFRGEPADEADYAWRSPDVVDRFAAELARHLTKTGYALVVLSSDGACPEYLRTFDRAGFRLARVARRRFANESLTVYRVAPTRTDSEATPAGDTGHTRPRLRRSEF